MPAKKKSSRNVSKLSRNVKNNQRRSKRVSQKNAIEERVGNSGEDASQILYSPQKRKIGHLWHTI